MKFKRSAFIATGAIAAAAILTGCISARLAKPMEFDKLTDPNAVATAAKEGVGYTDSNGVPTLAERFAKRPDLKVAVLQYGLYIQGDVDREFKDITHFSAMAAAYGGHYMTVERRTLQGVEVPGSVGLHVASDGVAKLETALAEAGFNVIPATKIAATKAYQAAYGAFPAYAVVEKGSFDVTSMAAGWTAFAPRGYRVKAPDGIVAIGQAHWVWPDTQALKAIKAELGEDVLFLTVAHRFGNHNVVGEASNRTRVGEFNGNIAVGVNDPDFVGYGIGGFGHIVTNFDMKMNPAPRPAFIKANAGGFVTDWNLLVKDAELVNTYYAKGIATAMAEKRNAK